MPKKLRKNKKVPKIFLQKCGHYHEDVLVICGASLKEVRTYLNRRKLRKNFTEWVLREFDDWKEDLDKKSMALYCYEEKIGGNVIMLKEFVDTWNFWETCMHEIHHLTLNIATKRTFSEEMENQAYLFEYLFRNIRRKIMGLDPM